MIRARALACLGCSRSCARAPGKVRGCERRMKTRRSSWTSDDFGAEERGCGCHSKSNSVSLFHVSFLNSTRRRRPQSTQATPRTTRILGHFSVTVFDFPASLSLHRTRQEPRRCFQAARSSIPPASTKKPSSATTASQLSR